MDIIPFTYLNFQIRTVIINNAPYFVAKDVAKALDLKDSKSAIRDLKNRFIDNDINLKGVVLTHPLKTEGGIQNLTVLSEIGLYEFVFSSRKKEAILFRYWISSDVLPQIRKTGSYSIQPTQKPQTQLSEYQETLEYIDMFEKFSEKTKGKSHIELLKLDSFLTKSGKKSVLDILNLDLKNSFFSVSELGEFSGQKGSEINQSLVKIGFQISENGVWKVLESGKEFCFETKNSFSQLKWKFSVLEKI